MPELAAGADDADGDLAAVGDEQALGSRTAAAPRRLALLEERAQPFLAFGRDAPARRSLAAVIAVASLERPAPTTCANQRLGRGDRLRARRRGARARSASTAASSSPAGTTRVHEPDLARARRGEARAGQEQLARGRAADLREHERRDHGRQDAELHLGEAEHRVALRRRRCRRPRPGRRRRRAPRRGRGRSSGTGSASSAANIRDSAAASRRFSSSRVVDRLRHPRDVGAGAERSCPAPASTTTRTLARRCAHARRPVRSARRSPRR